MFFLLITLVAVLIHLVLMKNRSPKKIVEVILLYLIVINLGFGNILAGAAHIFNGPEVAKLIGWPAGSPFQYEVGVADIAMGSLGIMCIFFRGQFWLAAILVNAVFLLGCMAGHIRGFVAGGNSAAYNIGPSIIVSDLIMPLALICLYLVLQRMGK